MTLNDESHLKLPLAARSRTGVLRVRGGELNNDVITQKNLQKRKNKNMQNEPNLNNSEFALSSFIKVRYLCLDTWYRGKNEPKTNPNEAISKPIRTHFLTKKTSIRKVLTTLRKTGILDIIKRNLFERIQKNAASWL